MATTREGLKRARRCVIKFGSAVLTDAGKGLNRDAVTGWAEQIAQLKRKSIECVVVSSGAVAAGMQRLGRTQRPRALHELQAMASIGQMGLVGLYESAFQSFGLHAAQVLLIHDDFTNRQRYLNARSTLRTLLDYGVIPVVNENDAVATDEIRLGDNDTLAALVTNLIEADLLLIVTDQGGLYDRDPRVHAAAALVHEGIAGDPGLLAMAGEPGALGRGGMRTKLLAAERAARSGAATVIAGGESTDLIARVLAGEPIGTYLQPAQSRVAARKQWLAGQLQVQGRVTLDAGAVKALVSGNKSLLPIGVTRVDGDFRRGEIVSCIDAAGREVARGLTNYSADEARRIRGQPSDRIEAILGYVDEPELIGRDNLVLT
jgi:glutamate 5-kinase